MCRMYRCWHRGSSLRGSGTLLALLYVASSALCQEERAAPIDPDGIRGTLVIAGGGELPEAVARRFVREARGRRTRIVVIPTASATADEEVADPAKAERHLAPWKALNVGDVKLLHTRSRETANDEAFLAPLKQATGVWFGGGEQSRLAEAYLGTGVEREIKAVLARGGVVGGTSAGAAIQSHVMIAGGNPEPTMATGFDLLPGMIVDQHFLARSRQPRLVAAIAKNPALVGIGIDEGTALVVSGRRMEVIGRSRAVVILAGSADGKLPRREIMLGNGDTQDLTALRRAAADRSRGITLPAQWPAPQLASGSLVIVGGGGMPKEITDKFMELAGGPDAPIVVLPTANPDAGRESQREGAYLTRLGFKKVTVLPQTSKDEVESGGFEEALQTAKGVWFGGGRQWRFVDAYAGTRAEALFREVLARGGVIGGSSAGATIQADYLVRGSPLGNEEMMVEGYERGLGFLPGTAVDQHFSQRKRFLDMTSLMRRHPQLLGIGIDEATALVVQGKIGEVVGRGQVHFYDYRSGPPAADKQDFTAVAAGGKYDLADRKVVGP
ncbi:MAG TPA: cyanophycinase [Pirellulaceae bacterium]|nr:cyanophycinase [Pirellulaceae bacterium]